MFALNTDQIEIPPKHYAKLDRDGPHQDPDSTFSAPLPAIAGDSNAARNRVKDCRHRWEFTVFALQTFCRSPQIMGYQRSVRSFANVSRTHSNRIGE